MLAKKQKLLTTLLALWFSGQAQANLGVAFSSGEGILDITPYRLAVSWDFGAVWRKEATWGLNAIWETSFAYWDGAKGNITDSYNSRMQVATTGPVLRWQRQAPYMPFHITPYLEVGVGASWFSNTEIRGRRLSLHFQFEDNIGIGARFGRNQQYDMTLRGYHYSNASIKRPNSGVNLVMFSIGYWLDN